MSVSRGTAVGIPADELARARSELRQVIQDRRLIVCVGSGGVGKTTTAAALAVQAAIDGRRVVVVTIDPARRLANSLGLDRLGNDERAIDPARFADVGVTARGSLHAMMLDTEATFDELIQKVSPDEATRERILGNRIYQQISDTLSASHDYMASEKLYDLYHSGRYDLIVLDTPPMKNAIDFLEASGRLARFLDDRIVSWFLKPHDGGSRFGASLLQAPGALVYRLLGNVFGTDFLDDLSEFFLAIADVLGGFRERAESVSALLRDRKETRFLVVCTPGTTSMEEARYFQAQLRERSMPGDFFVVNQVGPHPDAARQPDGRYLGDAERAAVRALLPDTPPRRLAAFLEKLETHFDRSVALAQADQSSLGALRHDVPGARIACVPRLPDDVYDLSALLQIDRHLFGLA